MSETQSSSEAVALGMEAARYCTSCGTRLSGPFEPELDLIKTVEEQEPEEDVTVTVGAWICPGCGLAHWYAQEQDLEKLETLAGSEEEIAAKPASSYERRMQVLHMLRRVRRM
jgi:hypothetical protein